ncbi:MAG TPA: HisA/HisF-related TIM barrel protein, partial [Xylella sp.]
LLSRITHETGLRVQTGGGVRSRDEVARILDAGAERVVIGSLAVRETARVIDWLHVFGPERITVALDTRQEAGGIWRLPVHGWTEMAESTLGVLAKKYAEAGLRHLLCTDIARDGMFSGPNMALYAYLQALVPGVQVQVSGGARHVGDVVAAKMAGCAGIVLGKALLDGRLALKEALQHGGVVGVRDADPDGEYEERLPC